MEGLLQLIVSVGTLVVAAVIAAVVGRRKGLADVEAKTDAEIARLVDALEGRIHVMTDALDAATKEVSRLRTLVAELTLETARLSKDLERERGTVIRLMIEAERRTSQ